MHALVSKYCSRLNDQLEADLIMEKVEKSLKDIGNYKKHIMKTFIQVYYWKKQFDFCNQNQIFLTMDWAQK